MRHQRDVALDGARLGDDAVAAGGDVVGHLAAGRAVAPQEPVRALLADLRRGQPLVLAVVPLEQVVAQPRALEARELRRLPRPRERGAEHEGEVVAGEALAQRRGPPRAPRR